MEKPVRIVENEKMRTFNDKVRNGLEHALNFMMGAVGEAAGTNKDESKIQISFFEPFLMPIEAYIQAYKKQSVMIKLFSDKDYKGELYWFFEIKTAVVLGAIMRMVPINSLTEKLAKGDFDAVDQDAFGEVGNQLSGILDRAFRSLTKKNIHLKMDFNKLVYPNEKITLDTFINKEEYVVLLCTITLPKHGGQKLTLLLPRTLYEVMLNLEISLEGITPKKVIFYSFNESVSESIQSQLNSRYTKVLVASSPDEILTMVDQPDVAALALDLKRVNFPLQHQDTIFFKRLASNRVVTRLPYFLTWENATAKEVEEVKALGLHGATDGTIAKEFARWAQAFTQDPSKK